MVVSTPVVVSALAGAMLVALGVYVASMRTRGAAHAAFAVFAIALGFTSLAGSLLVLASPPLDLRDASRLGTIVDAAGLSAAAAALVALGLTFPVSLATDDRRLAVGPAAAGGAYWALNTTGFLLGGAPASRFVNTAEALAGMAFYGAMWFALLLFARRFLRAEDGARRTQLALMSGALLVSVGYQTGDFIMRGGPIAVGGALNLVVLVLLTGMWIRGTTRPGGSPVARNLALLTLAVPLVAMTLRATDLAPWAGGAARGATVVVLAYAILKHRLLGIDLRLRWTISRGTLASAFLAVFFLVSEGTAILFENYTQSAQVGVAAASLLVFALAPLQRLADRVASAATGVGAPSQLVEEERLALYRRQAEIAWEDGTIGRRERHMLVALRRELGLTAEDAERVDAELTARARS